MVNSTQCIFEFLGFTNFTRAVPITGIVDLEYMSNSLFVRLIGVLHGTYLAGMTLQEAPESTSILTGRLSICIVAKIFPDFFPLRNMHSTLSTFCYGNHKNTTTSLSSLSTPTVLTGFVFEERHFAAKWFALLHLIHILPNAGQLFLPLICRRPQYRHSRSLFSPSWLGHSWKAYSWNWP